MAGRRAQKEAAAFQASIKPGRTYWSVVDLNPQHPGTPKQALLEWTFSKPGRWIGQEPRCGHMTAAGAWLGYGPLHATRPPKLMTYQELRRRPGIFGPDPAKTIRRATPAGV
jgi:hypothetical protein